MGIINDTTETIGEGIEKARQLPNFIIYMLMSLLMLSIYWFIGIYLFHKKFYLSNSIWIVFLFSFGLSFIWYIINFFISAIYIAKFHEKESSDAPFFVGGFMSIIYLCLIISILYFVKSYAEIGVKTFLLVSFSYIGLRLGGMLLSVLFYQKESTD